MNPTGRLALALPLLFSGSLAAQQVRPASPNVPAKAGGGASVVASVGDRRITGATLAEQVGAAINSRYYHGNLSPERERELRITELRALIRTQLDVLGALDEKVPIPLEEARRQDLADEEKLGRDAYRKALLAAGWTRQDRIRLLSETFLARDVRQRRAAAAAPTEAEIRLAYDANPARWKVPESQRLEHLSLAVPADAPPSRWKEREAEVSTLRKRIEAGEAFADVAAKVSEDMYRIKRGALGWVHKGRLEEPLDSSAWAARPGQIVGPLRTTFGVHLVKVLERRASRLLSLEEASVPLRKALAEQKTREADERWYAAVRSRHAVAVLDPALREAER